VNSRRFPGRTRSPPRADSQSNQLEPWFRRAAWLLGRSAPARAVGFRRNFSGTSTRCGGVRSAGFSGLIAKGLRSIRWAWKCSFTRSAWKLRRRLMITKLDGSLGAVSRPFDFFLSIFRPRKTSREFVLLSRVATGHRSCLRSSGGAIGRERSFGVRQMGSGTLRETFSGRSENDGSAGADTKPGCDCDDRAIVAYFSGAGSS